MTLEIREIGWSDTPEHLELVNESCSLRVEVRKRSHLHNRTKGTVRTIQARDSSSGSIVGGLTIRANAWYLAEIKYIFANTRKVLDEMLAFAIALGKRSLYQVTVAPGERVLRNALVSAGFEEGARIEYKGNKPVVFSRAVKYLDATVRAATDQRGLGREELACEQPASIEAAPPSAGSLNRPRNPEVKGKLHKHHDYGWHPASIEHSE